MQAKAIAVFSRIANLHLRTSEEGQDLLEYGLLGALIAVAAVLAVTTVGTTINTVFWELIAGAF